MKRGLIVAAALTAFVSTNAYSQNNPYTGNAILNDCKAVATGLKNNSDTTGRGVCLGTLNTLFVVRNLLTFCIPQTANVKQAVAVTVKYMEDNPQELHEELAILAAKALTRAWPCKN